MAATLTDLDAQLVTARAAWLRAVDAGETTRADDAYEDVERLLCLRSRLTAPGFFGLAPAQREATP